MSYFHRTNLFGMALIFCSVSSCVLAESDASTGASPQPLQPVSSDKPARICRQYDRETLKALKSGAKHLVIVVKNYRPPSKNGAGFVVSLVPEGTSKPLDVMRFGVHPEKAFPADKPGYQQRFLLPLDDHAAAIKGDRICLEVGFYSGGQASVGGEAAIAVEIAEPVR